LALLDDDLSWLPPKEPVNSELQTLEQNYLKSVFQIKDNYNKHVQQLDSDLKLRIKQLDDELNQEINQLKSEYKIKEAEETNLFDLKSKTIQQQVELELASELESYQQQQQKALLALQNVCNWLSIALSIE